MKKLSRPSVNSYYRQLAETPRALNDPRAYRWPLIYFIQVMEYSCAKGGEFQYFFCTIYEDKKS